MSGVDRRGVSDHEGLHLIRGVSDHEGLHLIRRLFWIQNKPFLRGTDRSFTCFVTSQWISCQHRRPGLPQLRPKPFADDTGRTSKS
jgi:hypothetical protein